mmetsp:Transcript_3084/g.8968  ORF Transcript_3084/g.8968 Transcript_3084/m.8968 type:complete len:278 (+) Transcript_3084:339-1172(+)
MSKCASIVCPACWARVRSSLRSFFVRLMRCSMFLSLSSNSSRSRLRRNCSPKAMVSRAGTASGLARRRKALINVDITGNPPCWQSKSWAHFMRASDVSSDSSSRMASQCATVKTIIRKKKGVTTQMKRTVNTLAHAPQNSPWVVCPSARWWKAIVPGMKVYTRESQKFHTTARIQTRFAMPRTSNALDLRMPSSSKSASCTRTVVPMNMSRKLWKLALSSWWQWRKRSEISCVLLFSAFCPLWILYANTVCPMISTRDTPSAIQIQNFKVGMSHRES